jgi:hypothetical protein
MNDSIALEFNDLGNLLNTPSKQKAGNKTTDLLDIKITNTFLMSLLLQTSFTHGDRFIQEILHLIYNLIEHILNTTNPIDVLKQLSNELNPEAHAHPLSASRTKVMEHLPQLTKQKMDDMVREQYPVHIEALRKHKAHSNKAMLAIDQTHEHTTSKYKNSEHSYVKVGQTEKWDQGLNYIGIIDTTNQLPVAFFHINKHSEKMSPSHLKPSLVACQNAITTCNSANVEVELLCGDRGYYDAEYFSAAYSGILSQSKGDGFIRILTPRQFSGSKKGSKMWDILTDQTVPDVSLQSIQLNHYAPRQIRDACKQQDVPLVNGFYKIPVAQVAALSPKGKWKYKTMDKLRKKAIRLQSRLKIAKDDLVAATHNYKAYYSSRRIKIRKYCHRIMSPRRVFRDDIERTTYLCLRNQQIYLDKLIEQKHSMCHSFMVFYIGIKPGEDPTKAPKRFYQYARDYIQRWVIENEFRDIKQHFLLSCRSQKSTRRQFRFMFGMQLYAHWQIHRCLDLLATRRKTSPRYLPYDSRRPHIRRRLERDASTIWDAETYLIRLCIFGLKKALNSYLKKGEKSH